MIKILCDRCGKDITNANRLGLISLNLKDQKEMDMKEEKEFEHCHYCTTCMKEIGEFIKRGKTAASSQCKEDIKGQNENGIETSLSGRRRVDVGKIMALKNAGWSNAKIDEEMGMTPAAVATQICVYRKKHAVKNP